MVQSNVLAIAISDTIQRGVRKGAPENLPEMQSLGPHFKLRIKSWKVEVPRFRRELLAEADVSSS